MRKRKWTIKQLKIAAKNSNSIRQLLFSLGLKEAGGNYKQIKKYLDEYQINTSHFRGKGWRKGFKGSIRPVKPLEEILVKNSSYQSYKLKKRLFVVGLKQSECELCGWKERSLDGRIPVELDHINGDSQDNRFENLRILCPNCHSLQSTHRGRNIKK
ncbi:HNH endonuclease [Patescibacteria group bacterium]|nr:HNH endonuclease [Patescibacteria group bacterium]MBU1885993.1 HNH endonuclease [Patescibacteria group bacterium]